MKRVTYFQEIEMDDGTPAIKVKLTILQRLGLHDVIIIGKKQVVSV